MVKTKIDRIMTREVITANQNDTIKDVLKILADNEISGLPVVDDDNNLLGIISEKDILKALKTESRTLSLVFPSSHALGMTFEESIDYKELKVAMKEMQNRKVEKIMNKEIITVEPNKTIAEVVNIMVLNNINRIPVIKDGKLKGIVTRGDVIEGLSKIK